MCNNQQGIFTWPKRDDLYNYLDELLLAPDHKDEVTALLMMDLDNFRESCEQFGYRDIDELLAKILSIIKQSCCPHNYIAWMGSDEFSVVMADTSIDAVTKTAQSICQVLNQSFNFHDKQVKVTASIGYALIPDDGHDRYELLKNATMAMNWVKKHGKNGCQRYNASMSAQVSRKMQIINGFSNALAEDQFFLHYQPQVNIVRRMIVGAEALIRWQHPEIGLMMPKEFIPLAEETGVINQIGIWVLQHACQDYSNWLQSGLVLERLAVNVSVFQLLEEDFTDKVCQILEAAQLDPAYLELEVTESQTANFDKIRPQVEELRKRGVKFAIDDFGTGFASFNHLRVMGLDTIKIDKQYIHNILTNDRDQVIVNSVLNMAEMLRLRIVAEGVETGEQRDYIQKLSIHEVQGYFYSPPLDKSNFATLVKQGGYNER